MSIIIYSCGAATVTVVLWRPPQNDTTSGTKASISMSSSQKKTLSRIGIIAIALASAAISALAHAQQDDATTAAFVAACKQAIPLKGYANSWFAQLSSRKIRTLDQAVQARKDALRTGHDDLTRTIQEIQHAIDTIEGMRRRAPGDKVLPLDEECAQRYIAYLQSLDAPSWEIARKASADESAARIEQQKHVLQAQQQAQFGAQWAKPLRSANGSAPLPIAPTEQMEKINRQTPALVG